MHSLFQIFDGPSGSRVSSLLAAVLLVPFLGVVAVAQCETQILTASDGSRDDQFGLDVSMDGDVAVVGAPTNGPGAAYVFRLNGRDWAEEQILTAADGAADDSFGTAVAVKGDLLAVGADGDDDAGYSSGAVYLFRWNGTAWVEEQKLTASDAAAGDRFGVDVALTPDRIMIGAPGQDQAGIGAGAAYLFNWNGSAWVEETKLMASAAEAFDEMGHAVALGDGVAVAGSPSADAFVGNATIFVWNGTAWVEQQTLVPSNSGGAAISFGQCVALDGDRIAVGAPFSVTGWTYLYRFDGQTWSEETVLAASNGQSGDDFGKSISLDGDQLMIGAIGHDDPTPDSGSAYLFAFDGAAWSEQLQLLAKEGTRGDRFGFSVVLHGDVALVGTPWDDAPGVNTGSVRGWRFDLIPATWNNYGTGWPGTFGIPGIIALNNPGLGATVEIEIENSRLTHATTGFLLVGLAQIASGTPLGGTLLVSPQMVLPISLPAFSQLIVSGTIPPDATLLGTSVFLQALENDPGASMGVSFTPGLELVIGEC